jgi:hypothetical protein
MPKFQRSGRQGADEMATWINRTSDDQTEPQDSQAIPPGSDDLTPGDQTAPASADDQPGRHAGLVSSADDDDQEVRPFGRAGSADDDDEAVSEDDQVVLAVEEEQMLPADDQVVLVVEDDQPVPADEQDGLADDDADDDADDLVMPADSKAEPDLPEAQPDVPAVQPDLAAADPDGAAMVAGSGPGSAAPGASAEGWHEIQVMFVDDPRASVVLAAGLVNDSVDAFVASVKERQSSLAAVLQGDDADTEQLRTALQQYRAFWSSLDDFSLES